MKFIACGDCGAAAVKRAPAQRYCQPCSAKRHTARQAKWARENPQARDPERDRAKRASRGVVAKSVGASAADSVSIGFDASALIDPLWIVRVAVPFSYGMSKNAVWRMAKGGGHVFMRKDARQVRDNLAREIKEAAKAHRVAINKLWIDIHVEKSNHKGDAVNVVDTVCDAIKEAIPLDDRWYCIRRLDWSVSKNNPRVIVGISQESDVDCQVCSVCGGIRPLVEFAKNRSNPNGHARECMRCKTAIRAAQKAAKANPRVEVDVQPADALVAIGVVR